MSAVARRYAKALFSLAQEADQLEQIANELEEVVSLVTGPELAPVWNNPLLNAQERRETVAELQRHLGFSELLGRFLGYLADHKRLPELPAICQVYQQLLDEAAGRARARIVTALPFSPEQVERVVRFLEQRTGKKVLAETVVDPSLLGGFLVEAEGKVFDASVTNQLALLAARLGAGTSH